MRNNLRLFIVGLACFLASCERRELDTTPALEEVVERVSSVLNLTSSSSFSSFSIRHSEYVQSGVVDIDFRSKEQAVQVSNAVKSAMIKGGWKLHVYQSEAVVRFEDGGFSGGIDSFVSSEFLGDEHGFSGASGSGEMISTEKLSIFAIIERADVVVLFNCRVFPAQNQAHFFLVEIR